MRIKHPINPPTCDDCGATAVWYVVNDRNGRTWGIGDYCTDHVPDDALSWDEYNDLLSSRATDQTDQS